MLRLIVNPAAGGGRAGRALGAVTTALASRDVAHRVDPTLSLEHARELTSEALAAGEMPVAFGGDGLIGAVADVMRGTGKEFGVLPGGRGNDFIRGLGIPLSPVAATSVLTDGKAVDLDIGVIGAHSFLGIAICGYDSVANQIANETKLVRGRLVYTYGGMRALAGWKPATFTVTLDGDPRQLTGYGVAVANSARHGGGMLLAPQARLDDGMFEVVLISEFSRLRFLLSLPRVFKGTHVMMEQVQVFRAREVELSADRPLTVFADGDPVSSLPLKLSVMPSAVRVLIPAGGLPGPERRSHLNLRRRR